MTVVFSTDDLPAAERYDAWMYMLSEQLGPYEVDLNLDRPPSGRLRIGNLGPVRIVRAVAANPLSLRRSPRIVRSDGRELYRLILPTTGRYFLEQDGRRVRYGRGELVLTDFGRPFRVGCDSPPQHDTFSVPRALVPFGPDTMRMLCAVPIRTDEGSGALLAPLLRRVATHLDRYPPAVAARLSTALLDLLIAVVTERLDRPVNQPAESRQRALLFGVYAYIETHLGDPRLSPHTIATAHHISVRYLYQSFDTEPVTVAALIRQRRLERCRADLADPRLAAVPVAAIAARWGMRDPASFSRLFRAAYGVPPGEYRTATLHQCLAPEIF
jgi:AraC-like DNA-binding protein